MLLDTPGMHFEVSGDFSFSTMFRPKMANMKTSKQNLQYLKFDFQRISGHESASFCLKKLILAMRDALEHVCHIKNYKNRQKITDYRPPHWFRIPTPGRGASHHFDLGPLCSLHRRRCEAPLHPALSTVKIRSKTSKIQLFQKMFDRILDIQKSLRNTPGCFLMLRECILRSLETFHFGPFFHQKMSNVETSEQSSEHQTIDIFHFDWTNLHHFAWRIWSRRCRML